MGWDWSFGHMPYGQLSGILATNLHSSARRHLQENVGRLTVECFNVVFSPRLHQSIGRYSLKRLISSLDVSFKNLVILLIIFDSKHTLLSGAQRLTRFSNAASTIMKVIYGIEVAEHDDHYIEVAETALNGMAKAAHPGAFLVDIFPSRSFKTFYHR